MQQLGAGAEVPSPQKGASMYVPAGVCRVGPSPQCQDGTEMRDWLWNRKGRSTWDFVLDVLLVPDVPPLVPPDLVIDVYGNPTMGYTGTNNQAAFMNILSAGHIDASTSLYLYKHVYNAL